MSAAAFSVFERSSYPEHPNPISIQCSSIPGTGSFRRRACRDGCSVFGRDREGKSQDEVYTRHGSGLGASVAVVWR